MQNFKLLNNVLGWAMFLIAAYTFIATMEPTASFWDCGEFIAVSYKLMVPHPPGAPLFLMISRMFSLLAGDDVTQVAYWVNMVSALSSAFTVLFLYWSITYLGIRFSLPNNKGATSKDLSAPQGVGVLLAGVIGSLVYTFSDSFWFSATEAEVYSMSGLFTAIVFWATLKWDSIADTDKHADRWLLFIAYMIGLSIGVHLLSLLVLPSLALIYYYRKYKETTKGAIIAFAIGYAIIFFVQSFVIPGLPSIAAKFEVLFTNSFGMPFNTGVIIFSVLVIGGVIYTLLYSIKKRNYLLQMGMLSLLFILIGYMSFGVVLIRANFNPPINENNPDNVISFVSYLKREQYGDRPIVYGPQYNAQPVKQSNGAPIYIQKDGKYVVAEYNIENEYASKDKTLFPRLYSSQPNHIRAYSSWVKLPRDKTKKPSMGANLGFFFKYQLGHMYFRYLGWNFIGRESDIQDAGVLFLSSKDIPESLSKNMARNAFYALPFIFGLIGLVFQYLKDKRNWLVLLSLFFTTGAALIIFANPPPMEPRERDYVFTGSTYAFSIWIGLGTLAIAELLAEYLKMKGVISAIIAFAITLPAPILMAKEGWDDHDRSKRFFSVESAKNLLDSCAPNAILFTGGDNDTFPLWYVQEVEGYRTDVRICNLSLLGTDWYAKQMKEDVYDGFTGKVFNPALPLTLNYENFLRGKNDYLPYDESNPLAKRGIDLEYYINAVAKDAPEFSRQTQAGKSLMILPSQTLSLRIDTNAVKSLGIVPKDLRKYITNNITWQINKGALYKNDLLMLDMIATSQWKRPIYFSTTLQQSNYLGLKQSMVLEGLAYRLLPIVVPGANDGSVDIEQMRKNMMEKFSYKNLNIPGIYYDENYRRFPLSLRNSFVRLASAQLANGDTAAAVKSADFCLKAMPDEAIPFDPYSPRFVEIYASAKQMDKAEKIAKIMERRAIEDIKYYSQTENKNDGEVQNNLFILQELYFAYMRTNNVEKGKYYEGLLQQYASLMPQQEPQGDFEE